jgi:hypothetical protein
MLNYEADFSKNFRQIARLYLHSSHANALFKALFILKSGQGARQNLFIFTGHVLPAASRRSAANRSSISSNALEGSKIISKLLPCA